jgi:hypothetical protein
MLYTNTEKPALWIKYDTQAKDFVLDFITTIEDVCGEIA